MNFAGVKSITIPEGDVKSIAIGGVTVWEKPSPLPYDAEVEYVESTGTQWIDTGVAPAGSTVLVDCIVLSNFSTTQVIVGPGGAAGNWFGNENGYFSVAANVNCGPSSVRSLIRVEYLQGLIRAMNVATGETCQTTTGTLASRNIGLFATAVPSFFAMARIFSVRISASGTLVRDFVPVRVGTAGYLYDRANPTGGPSGNGLYGSATSTPLAAGPDKN